MVLGGKPIADGQAQPILHEIGPDGLELSSEVLGSGHVVDKRLSTLLVEGCQLSLQLQPPCLAFGLEQDSECVSSRLGSLTFSECSKVLGG